MKPIKVTTGTISKFEEYEDRTCPHCGTYCTGNSVFCTPPILKKKEKCQCKEICGGNWTKTVVHLTGCPEDSATKEYDARPWYKKLFAQNPHTVYERHKRDTIYRV